MAWTNDQWNLFWRRVRLWGLVGVIAFACAMLGLQAIGALTIEPLIWWVVGMFGTIIAVVLVFELAAYLSCGHTISQIYGMYLKKQPVPALVSMACFIVSMLFLCAHFWGYVPVKKSEDNSNTKASE